MIRRPLGLLLLALALALALMGAGPSLAQEAAPPMPPAAEPSLGDALAGALPQGGGSTAQNIVVLVGLLTVLSLAPAILIMMTSFTRIVIVLSFLRSAIGVPQTPPNSVLIGLALFLTGFVMAPTLQAAYDEGLAPYLSGEESDAIAAFGRAAVPMKRFMLAHTRDADLALFVELSGAERPDAPEELGLEIVVPSFMISELKRAFEIGFLLFLPFLVIDMVVASILMAMGMMMLPPVTVSLPFKVIFFVLVDGWNLVVGSLVRSYGTGPPTPG